MKKNFIPIMTGMVILVFAIILAVVTASTGKAKLAYKRTLSQKYVNQSISALKMNDISKAILHAKSAIKADPSNPRGFACYKNAIAAQYKGLTTPKVPTATSNPPPAAAPQMGC